MGELDRVLDTVMKDKAELIMQEATEEEREEIITSLREHKKREIIAEIRKEYKEELIQEAYSEAKKASERQKIEDLKSLMWSGFCLPLLLGLQLIRQRILLDIIREL